MRKQGFILLETLLALALSAGVIFSMLNTYQNADKIMKKMDAILRINKSICLMFNQFERDISTALIGPFSQDSYTPEEPTSSPEKKVEQKKPLQFFYASSYGDITLKKEEYVMKMLRSLSIINSNPFIVYQEPKQRMVRVFYELIPLKKDIRNPEDQRYELWRSETTDLANTEAKIDPKKNTKKQEQIPIIKQCIAKNIISFFIFYHFPPDEKQKNNAENQKKEQTAHLPALVDIECTIEDEYSGIRGTYNAAFPTIPSTELEKKETEPTQEQNNSPQNQITTKPQTNQAPAHASRRSR